MARHQDWTPEERSRIVELLARHPEISWADLSPRKMRRLLKDYLAAEGVQDPRNEGQHSSGANRALEGESRYQGGYSD